MDAISFCWVVAYCPRSVEAAIRRRGVAVTSMEAGSMASAMDSTAAAATLAAVSSNASAAASTELSSTDVAELSSTVAATRN